MVGRRIEFEVAYNARRQANMDCDIARLTTELVKTKEVPSMTNGLVSGVDVELPMTME